MEKAIGYYRVSTADQNAALQISALEKAGCYPIFGDQGISGFERDRPEFEKALNSVPPGGKLVIWRLDRMSRSLKHLIEINQVLNSRDAYFESLTEKIDTSSPMGEFVFHILGAVAQLERAIIRERTLAGLAVAASEGKYPGRPRKLSEDELLGAAELIFACDASWEIAAEEYGVHPETLRRNLKQVNLALNI